MNKYRVLCVIDSLHSGGAQRQLVGLAGLLNKQNVQVKIIYYYYENFYSNLLSEYSVESKYIECTNIGEKFFKIGAYINFYKPNIVISYLDGPIIITSLWRVLGRNFKLITSERNTTQKISLREKLKFYLYRFSDSIVCNSYSQAAFIHKQYPNLSLKTSVITNFVDDDVFKVSIRDCVKHQSQTRFLVLARIVEQKNVKAFIEAFSMAVRSGCDVRADWYGMAFNSCYYDECNQLLADLALKDRFFFHNSVENVVDLYKDADVFCLPSIYEGFPNVICEAMSCGLPVLCSDVCDNSKMVDDEVNGFLFNPLDVNDIASKIEHFSKDLSLLEIKSMGLNSYRLSKERFSKNKFIMSYMNIIQKILDR